ncbi:MAG TPA: NAD(P)-dependent oxidoreductase [Thermoleophilaceae bacterium]|jgi:3-hydroxyisobutyrate dehydrogenase-like beta-hydroxyacid dehydrogenase
MKRIAFLGLGIMGRPMAANLAAAGFEVTAWNRTAARAEELAEEAGVATASTPAEAAAAAEATITMVVDAPQVEQVLFGDGGAASGMDRGHLAIDMSTIAPTASRRIGERLAGRGVDFLDAPVTGSRPKAEAATLTIMAGGEEAAFDRARPVLEAMGELVVRVGPRGHGSMAKLVNNTLAAVNAASLAEQLALAGRFGLDPDALLEVVRAGSGASAMVDLKARPMLDRDLDPLFKLDHMLKDVRHCLAEARELGVRLPLAELAERLYAEASERGLGDRDFAAVIEVADPR